MDCKHVDTLLMDYLYQELDPSQAEHVEAHLQACPRCAGELSAFERTRATMRGLPELEPPTALEDVLLREAAKAVRLQPEPAPSFWQRVRESLRLLVLNPAMTAAVTLVVVLGISFVIYRNSPPPKSGPSIDQPTAPVSAESSATEDTGRATPPAATGTVPRTRSLAGPTDESAAQKHRNEKVAEVAEDRRRQEPKEEETASGEKRSAENLRQRLAGDEAKEPKLMPVVGRSSRIARGAAEAAPQPEPQLAKHATGGARPHKKVKLAAVPQAETVVANRPAARASKGSPYDDADKGGYTDGKRDEKQATSASAPPAAKPRPAPRRETTARPVMAKAEPKVEPKFESPKPVKPTADLPSPAATVPKTASQAGAAGPGESGKLGLGKGEGASAGGGESRKLGLGKAGGTAAGADQLANAPLKENVRVYSKPPRRYKKSPAPASLDGVVKNKDQNQAQHQARLARRVDSEERPHGKGKFGQTSSAGKQQAAGLTGGVPDYWVKQGFAAQKRGDCSHALAYYERALSLEPKLAKVLAGAVRSCAATLNETALAEARKQNRRLSGMLNLEVARRAKMRQKAVDLESASTGKAGARKAKAAPAKDAPTQGHPAY